MFALWLVMSCGLPAKPNITVPESAVAFPGDLTHIPRLGFVLKSTMDYWKKWPPGSGGSFRDAAEIPAAAKTDARYHIIISYMDCCSR